MSLNLLLLITFISTINLAYAENHLLILGGGGDPKGNDTIFDSDLNNFGENLEKSKWSYDVSFNGGHKDTEEIIKNSFSKSKSPANDFSPQNFKKLIDSYKLKIENNEIESGDQIMLLIYSHGGKRESGQISHNIGAKGGAATDLNNLAGATPVDLDNLKELIKLTNKKGIKLGIVDLSCHSGSTLALKVNAPNTCIVSATSPEHLAYVAPNTFTNNFLKGLRPGLSLEEVFLKARRDSPYSEYPMISTNENNEIVKDVYNSITPYLYYYSPENDKLSPYILDSSSLTQFCKREDSYSKLISKIDNLQSVLNSKHNLFNANILKNNLKEYKQAQDNVIKTSMKISSYKLDKVEVFSSPPEAKNHLSKVKINYTWKELLDFEADYFIKVYEKSIELSKSSEDKRDYQLQIDFLKKISSRKQQILKENPQFVNYKRQATNLVMQMKNTRDMAEKIALQEKVLYDELYRRNQRPNPDDPCKSITF